LDTLRSLSLRARSGATIVAFERGGEKYTNPDPDMPLRAGDRLLILGTTEQIAAASLLMSSKAK
jgi:TrkA domain protein